MIVSLPKVSASGEKWKQPMSDFLLLSNESQVLALPHFGEGLA